MQILSQCDPTGEAAFKYAEDMAERIALLASSEKSSLLVSDNIHEAFGN